MPNECRCGCGKLLFKYGKISGDVEIEIKCKCGKVNKIKSSKRAESSRKAV